MWSRLNVDADYRIGCDMQKAQQKGKQYMKKAPGAPKRGKSAYICFTMAKRDEVKRQLGPDAKVGACRDSKNDLLIVKASK